MAKSAEAWFEKGVNAVRARGGNLESAVAAFDEALGLEPAHQGALRERAFALAQLGQHEAALDSLVAAAAQTKDDPEVLLAVGQSLMALHRYDEALKSFEQVLALRPADEEARCGRADLLMALDDFEGALREWEVVLAAPRNETLEGRRGAGILRSHARRSHTLALGRLGRDEAFAAFCGLIVDEVAQLCVPSKHDALLRAVRDLEVARLAFRSWLEVHACEPSTWRHAEDIWFEANRSAEVPASWVLKCFAKSWFDKAEARAEAGELSVAIYGYERSLELSAEVSAAERLKAVQAQRDGGRWMVMSHNAYAREDSVAGEFTTRAEAAAYLAQLQASSNEHFWMTAAT